MDVPCRIYRGGTSRGIFFLESDLPAGREERERILLRVFGSPDPRQIDGLGGANAQTSKAMIVGPASAEEDADVAMLFAQVAIEEPVVDWGGNCGNLTSAVGVFAIDSALVEPEEPETVVRIVSRNTGLRVNAHIPVQNGRLAERGDFEIPGVPGHAARIDLDWLEPGGSAGRGVLPSGNVRDSVTIGDGRAFEVSVVDAANPVVLVSASDLGLTCTELPAELEAKIGIMDTLYEIRDAAAKNASLRVAPNVPKIAIVAPPSEYVTSRGEQEKASGHDLQARMMAMRTAHRSYAVTAGICTAVAARIPGTIVPRADAELVRIAHPFGVMDVRVRTKGTRVESARVGRTARLLMTGVANASGSE